MVQGTASGVGKSLLVTALCRIFRQDGYRVAPFKAQNMSLNSYVTSDGAEVGRAQAVQADAAEVPVMAEMNPVLLKPEVDYRSQLVVMGRPMGSLESRDFGTRKNDLWEIVTAALDRLRADFDVVVIEGAGSPAEINLRQGDIVNMEVALYAQAPVLLVGDIDKGGVFASLYGTLELLAAEERELVRGLVINKFRGDVSILEPGLDQIRELTAVPVIGVVPYLKDIDVPEEDSPSTQPTDLRHDAVIDVAVIALPHISNFDDFDPIGREAGVGLRYVRSPGELGAPDMVILPGTKTTASDLDHLRKSGMADSLVTAAARGTAIVGVCGGYQMLGRAILDPARIESQDTNVRGLGLLPVVTRFGSRKETRRVSGTVELDTGLLEGAGGLPLVGYEIHMGTTEPEVGGDSGGTRAPFRILGRTRSAVASVDGTLSSNGWVLGTYLHGLFHNSELLRSMLTKLAARKGAILRLDGEAFSQSREYDKLADLVRKSLDMEAISQLME